MTRRSAAGRHQHLYAALESAATKSDLVDVFFRISDEFSFRAATLMIMPAKTDTAVAGLVLQSQLPAEFFARHDELSQANKCPLFDAARASIVPVVWSTEQAGFRHRVITGDEPPIIKLYFEYGLPLTALFPVTSIDGSRHVIRYDGDRDPLGQDEINDLSMLSLHFFAAYDRARFPLSNNPCGLTERELEVMRWTATGKTSSEIGQILSLSDHTINAYMNNAFKKLDCVNRTQLVAKALRMRVIS